MPRWSGSRGGALTHIVSRAWPLFAGLLLVMAGGAGGCEKEMLNPASGGRAASSTGVGSGGSSPAARYGTNVSSTLALSHDDARLWVVNPDTDSVSVIDVASRSLSKEIALSEATPALDPNTLRYEPSFAPRALALAHGKVYVAAQTKNAVLVIDARTYAISTTIEVAAAPVAVAASPDGSSVYVVSHEGAMVTAIDTSSDTVRGTVAVSAHPWGASVSADGSTLFVTHLLADPGVSVIDTGSLSLTRKTPITDQPAGNDKRIPNGVARGAFAVAASPTGDLWVPYMLLGTGTPQPELDFESTVFPTISIFDGSGVTEKNRLLLAPPGVIGASGSFADVVSGAHAVAFTPDAKLALVAFGQSEDVMVFDAQSGFERGLVRPIPSTMLEGIVVDHQGKHAFVDGRNTHDITVLTIDEDSEVNPVVVDGAAIDRLMSDPMPAQLRRGQRLFYSANSAELATTQNFWVACATCHIEGGSDAVTWQFDAGPRDTPSNAGGPSHTGFLMRQALRSEVQQYDATIRLEQGGHYSLSNSAQKPDLDALAAFVNEAIPFPQNPNVGSAGLTVDQAAGQTLFAAHCQSCHSGSYFTDSGQGNPSLSFTGTILLHDIGTCAETGAFRDRVSLDVSGVSHTACDFDTPSLRGVFATPPYFHDGSSQTLEDVVARLSFSSSLSAVEQAQLAAYLRTL